MQHTRHNNNNNHTFKRIPVLTVHTNHCTVLCRIALAIDAWTET